MPPSGEYLIAFERRFPTTCASRFGSPRTVSGPFGKLDLELVLGTLRRVQLRLLVEQRGEVDLLRGEVDALVLDPLDVEEVLQQRREAPRLRVDDAEVVATGRRVELPLQQERGEAEHARERRPELVGDDVDKLGLHSLALA